MPRIPCRKFTVSDIMILVGATAVGLALARAILPMEYDSRWYAYSLGIGSPLLFAWSAAHLVICLRRPHPRIRLLYRRPGAVSSLVAIITFSIWSACLGIRALRDLEGAYYGIAYSAVSVGPAVLGSWLALGATRTARPDPGWIDRSGRFLGAGWLILMLIVFWKALA